MKSDEDDDTSTSGHCYCGGNRDVGALELYCTSCDKWFHGKCLQQLKNFTALPFMVCYNFHCTDCSPTDQETWVPRKAEFSHMCITALANMTWTKTKKISQKICFSLQKEIIPYVEKNWENLTSMPRRQKTTWHQTLHRAMSNQPEIFYQESAEGDDTKFGLVETELDRIGPNHSALKTLSKRTSSGTQLAPVSASEPVSDSQDPGPKTRGAKRKAENQTNPSGPKKTKTGNDSTLAKFSGFASPIDHPFNRDGYRYFLAEPDFLAPNRRQFDESEDTAGKPIPAYMYRVVRPSVVELSSHDRAPQLKLHDDHLTVTGEKGYSVVRCSHGVSRGAWYYEVTFVQQPAPSHTRIGWSQPLGCVQAPIGYDKFSYAWRSRKGTRFHESIGKHYSDGYQAGDVLGFYIDLPENFNEIGDSLPESHKDLPLIRFKNQFFYEEKDKPQETIKAMKPLKGSKIVFYKNGVNQGVAFTDIPSGTYHPGVSLYKNATVTCNFGPKFKFPPKDLKFRPMSDRAEELYTDQTMADVLFFVQNEGSLSI